MTRGARPRRENHLRAQGFHPAHRLADRRQIGQLLLVFNSLVLLGSAISDLRALGLLASQLGNVNMSGVSAKETSEVGGRRTEAA